MKIGAQSRAGALVIACGLLVSCSPEEVASLATGDPCRWGLECSGGVCLASHLGDQPTGWSDGMCTSLCADGICPQGQSCTDLTDGLYCLPSCDPEEAATECREGYVCHTVLEVCYPDCRLADFCSESYKCATQDGQCRFEFPTSGAIGSPCLDNLDCATGWCFADETDGLSTGWTDGMCTMPCPEVGCAQESTCAMVDGHGYCLPSCLNDTQCRPGYVCHPQGQVCLPDCRTGWECGDGFACTDLGICAYQWPLLQPLGGPCQESFDCSTNWCLPPMNDAGQPTGWTQGMCTTPCGPMGCPPGSNCMVMERIGWCLPMCFGPPEQGCRPAYVCDPDVHLCLPDCQNGWDCGSQMTCGTDGVCKPPGW